MTIPNPNFVPFKSFEYTDLKLSVCNIVLADCVPKFNWMVIQMTDG